MKKIYITSLFLISLLPMASAQKGFHIGLEGAYNASFIMNQDAYGEQELDYTATMKWAGGAEIGYNFDRHFGLQAEIITSNQGQHYLKQVAGQPTIYRNVDLNYTNIPFFIKYSSNGNYQARFYLMAGPQLSLLNTASIYYKDAQSEYTIDAKPRFNSQDWAVAFEFGVDVTLIKNMYASAGLRFNYGLTDINSPDYRIVNHDGIYQGSRNVIGGINVGLHYVLFGREK